MSAGQSGVVGAAEVVYAVPMSIKGVPREVTVGARRRPTMNDVARIARVSLKTVSRVVNGEPNVSPVLVAQVRSAIEALNYRPDFGASVLRRSDRRTGTIALLLEDVGNPFCSALHRAVEDVARGHGVQVISGSLDGDPQRERELTRVFTMRRLVPSRLFDQQIRKLNGLPA